MSTPAPESQTKSTSTTQPPVAKRSELPPHVQHRESVLIRAQALRVYLGR